MLHSRINSSIKNALAFYPSEGTLLRSKTRRRALAIPSDFGRWSQTKTQHNCV